MDTVIAIIIIVGAGIFVFNKVRKQLNPEKGGGCGCGGGCSAPKSKSQTNSSCCQGSDCSCDK